MLEGIIKKLQADSVLMDTKEGEIELPLSAFDQIPQLGENFFISVSKENSAKKVINELLRE